MSVLACDVCGGILSIDAGGQTATCEFCGAKHSIERMREKVQEIKGTVSITGTVQVRQTGAVEDVKQWEILINKYMKEMDYKSALPIAKKMLEAMPSDETINRLYDELKELQFLDIQNGVLYKYNGRSDQIIIPEGVEKIEVDAFKEVMCNTIGLPASLKKIFSLPWGCSELNIPQGVIWIGADISCSTIYMPEGVDFSPSIFEYCSRLENVVASSTIKEKIFCFAEKNRACMLASSPWYKQMKQKEEMLERTQRINSGLCLYCGGTFKGIRKKICSKCGKKKGY